MLILNGLFKSPNIVIASHYVQGGAAFFQFLQPDVMHNFNKITSGHICPSKLLKLCKYQEDKIKLEVEGQKR
jgi:hypothetical protein